MTHIFALANQKGGVGKTTTSINLSASLSATKRRLLLIDMDPQGNSTVGSGLNKQDLHATICEVLLGECSIEQAIQSLPACGYDLLPANADLTAAEIRLINQNGREFCLRHALAQAQHRYDYILIDCPPSLNMLTVNALCAADGVIIPMQCEYYALEGLSELIKTVEKIRQSANPRLKIEGLLRTMYDPRNNLANDVSTQLKDHFGECVYRTIIPRNIRLAEAPSFGRPIIQYDRSSRGALAYLALAGEILRREHNMQPV